MQIADLSLPIRPISKARPRSYMGQSRPYTDKVYKEWLGQCRALALRLRVTCLTLRTEEHPCPPGAAS